jgi:hypothetical protein
MDETKQDDGAGLSGSGVERQVRPLVARLREAANAEGSEWDTADSALMREAAASIERMQADAARQNKLMHLAAQDKVFFGGFIYDPEDREFRVPAPMVLCNDFFAPAADAEELPVEDIDALHDAYLRFGSAGVLAWVSLRREGADPWRLKPGSEFHDQFRAAREALRPNVRGKPPARVGLGE